MKSVRKKLVVMLAAILSAGISQAEIFVGDIYSQTIGTYTTAGAPVNPALVTGSGGNFVIADSFIYVINNGPTTQGSISKYTISGALVNASLISGLNNPSAMAVSGDRLFISEYNKGTIGEYTTAGTTVNNQLITGLYEPQGLALSGSNLYVANGAYTNAWIGKYTTEGATTSSHFINGLNGAYGLAIEDSRLYVAQRYGGSIGVYDGVSGSTINSALVSGLNQVIGVAVDGGDLYVADPLDSAGTGTVGKYTITGNVVSKTLISGLRGPVAIAVSGVPEPETYVLMLFGFCLISLKFQHRQRKLGKRFLFEKIIWIAGAAATARVVGKQLQILKLQVVKSGQPTAALPRHPGQPAAAHNQRERRLARWPSPFTVRA